MPQRQPPPPTTWSQHPKHSALDSSFFIPWHFNEWMAQVERKGKSYQLGLRRFYLAGWEKWLMWHGFPVRKENVGLPDARLRKQNAGRWRDFWLSQIKVLWSTHESSVDLGSGGEGRRQAMRCFKTCNWCIPIANTLGESAVVCCACALMLHFLFCSVMTVRRFDFRLVGERRGA
jgi:hypothetical protein